MIRIRPGSFTVASAATGRATPALPLPGPTTAIIMFVPFKRLSLGLLLLLGTSALLLLSDLGSRHTTAPDRQLAADNPPHLPAPEPGRVYRIGFAYYAPEPAVDSCRQGVLDGLAELGYVEGRNLEVTRTHAQGEVINIPAMLQNLDSSGVDLIVTFSTPVLQGALATVKHKPVVFTYCTDPLAAGAGTSFTHHNPNVTGVGSLPPVADTVGIIRQVLPRVKTLGTIYNNGEANSTKIISLLRAATQKAGLNLVELTASNSNEVFQAMQALVTRHIDAFYMPSDNTMNQAYDGIRKIAADAHLPIICEDPELVARGALFSSGPGFYYSGKAAAPRIARVLHGASPAGIPLENVSVNLVRFNPKAAARLGLHIDPALIRQLEAVSTTTPAAKAATPNPTRKKWKIAYVYYNETAAVEETLAGMADAWKHSALVAGRDYELSFHSAQGDMAALGTIIDAIRTAGTDLIVPITTPALQAAISRVKRRPMVFALVADPIVAGAGRSYTDHLPNLTGAPVPEGCDEALALLAKYYPTYKRLGTLFCPAEANSVAVKEELATACRRHGFQLETVAANSSSELPDAALALMSRPIDAVLQLSDNLTNAGFTAITRAARRTHTPLFSLTGVSIPYGSAVAVGRDYHSCGKMAVALIERIIRGEDPAKIPFAVPDVTTTASPANAAALGMTLPPALLAQPNLIIKTPHSATKSAASAGAPPPRRLALIQLVDAPTIRAVREGMITGLAQSGLRQERDYTLRVLDAQGDISMLGSLTDAALVDHADLILTITTPALQTVMQRVRDRPVIFALALDPLVIGDTDTHQNHRANVAGIIDHSPFAAAMKLVRECLPNARAIGSLYNPAESNSVAFRDDLIAAAKAAGLRCVTLPVSSPADVPDAASALCQRGIDVFMQINDNLSDASFPGIAQAARRAHVPLFTFSSQFVRDGLAVLSLANDFSDAGREAGRIAARVLRGENPAGIPYRHSSRTRLVVNPGLARDYGITLPPALLARADEIIKP